MGLSLIKMAALKGVQLGALNNVLKPKDDLIFKKLIIILTKLKFKIEEISFY